MTVARHLSSILLVAASALAAEESPIAIDSLPDTVRDQFTQAAGGASLSGMRVIEVNGQKTYVATYRNATTGSMEVLNVDQNGRLAQGAQAPASAVPAIGTTTNHATGAATNDGKPLVSSQAPVLPAAPANESPTTTTTPPAGAGPDPRGTGAAAGTGAVTNGAKPQASSQVPSSSQAPRLPAAPANEQPTTTTTPPPGTGPDRTAGTGTTQPNAAGTATDHASDVRTQGTAVDRTDASKPANGAGIREQSPQAPSGSTTSQAASRQSDTQQKAEPQQKTAPQPQAAQLARPGLQHADPSSASSQGAPSTGTNAAPAPMTTPNQPRAGQAAGTPGSAQPGSASGVTGGGKAANGAGSGGGASGGAGK